MQRIAALVAFLPLALPFAPIAPATAASFDCSKASTAFERGICGSPELGDEDEMLARAYATAIGGLSKPAAEQMRDNQRDWLDYAARACTDDAEPRTSDYTEEQHNCLLSTLSSRIRDLEGSRMISGWRFYMVDDYAVLPADPEESGAEYIKVATKEYSSPRIDGSDATAAEFNAFAEALVKTLRAAAGEGMGPDDRTSDIDTRIEVTSAQSTRITMTILDAWYGHGAAHGNYTTTYAHFLPVKGRGLLVEDVFTAENWVEPVAKLAYDALKVSLGEYMWEDLEEPVKEWVADPARWNFTTEGLIVQFQPYEVTAYSAGAPRIMIPWSVLEPYTNESIFAIAYY